MKYSSFTPVELISGKGCVSSFGRFSSFGRRCAIITGKNMLRHCSAVSDAETALKKENIEYILIAEAENNPSVHSVIDFAQRVNAFGADFIIGAGGGSAMDSAKATALLATNPVDENDVFSHSYTNKPLPTLLIGTTAGTGSEVMPSAVLTSDGEIPIKKSLKTKDSYAVLAFCDASYTASMPRSVTVSTALDSVCHAVEAIYSKRATAWAEVYGHAALGTVFPRLRQCYEENADTEELREALHFGSILAGLAINDGGTSFPHSMGYMLTTCHNAPHGFACAIFIGEFLRRVAKICDISKTLGVCGFNSVDAFEEYVLSLTRDCYDIPVITKSRAEEYAALAMKMSVNNNYLDLTINDCIDIYTATDRERNVKTC